MLNIIKAKKIVIKIGTSTLTHETGKLNLKRIEKFVRAVSDLKNSGKEIVVVTSGAVAVGAKKLGFCEKPSKVNERQATAAVGQLELMYLYDKFFSEYSHIIAQILLSKDVMADAEGRKNVENTFETLLSYGVIPIVNENDSLSIDELMFGDNDTLSAVVASLINADVLVILSDIDGLFDKDPREHPDARLIPVVYEITPGIEELAGGAGSNFGTGGMTTKIAAAKIATEAGGEMIIANGTNPEILYDIFDGKINGTLFLSRKAMNYESKS